MRDGQKRGMVDCEGGSECEFEVDVFLATKKQDLIGGIKNGTGEVM